MQRENTSLEVRLLALAAALTLVVGACTSAATPAPTVAPTVAPTTAASAAAPTAAAGTLPPKFTVRFLATVGNIPDWAPYVGKANGYFTELNVDLQYTTFQNSPDVFNAIVSGQGDLALVSLPTALTAALQGAPAKLISATQYASPKGAYDDWWAVLPSSTIKTPADLKGKKVDIFAQSSLAQAITRNVLSKAGINAGDYTEVSIPFPQSFTALDSGQIDIGLFIEPFYSNSNSLLKAKGQQPLRVVYTFMTYFTDGVNFTALMANTDWAAKNRDGLKRFFAAWFKAAKWGNDPANKSLLRAIIANGAGVNLDTIKDMETPLVSEDGKFLPGFLAKFQDLMVQNKMVPNLSAPLAEDKFVDPSYLP